MSPAGWRAAFTACAAAVNSGKDWDGDARGETRGFRAGLEQVTHRGVGGHSSLHLR